jgi:ubiquinone/menaquinone biosynthesis C-methylase UbiE
MADHKQIYLRDGPQYHELVLREDFQGNLLSAITEIVNIHDLDILDLGTGTGRLAKLLAPRARSFLGLDLSHHMISVAADQINKAGYMNCWVSAADHRALPVMRDSVDLVISGWSLCYLVVWEGENWQIELTKGLREMKRVIRPGGSIIVIETLGTGTEEPQELDKLKVYINHLRKIGFQETWIRTDYQFESRPEAVELTSFFFGEEMVEKIQFLDKPILPECTGIWCLKP